MALTKTRGSQRITFAKSCPLPYVLSRVMILHVLIDEFNQSRGIYIGAPIYRCFVSERTARMKSTNPGISEKDIDAKLVELWRELPTARQEVAVCNSVCAFRVSHALAGLQAEGNSSQ